MNLAYGKPVDNVAVEIGPWNVAVDAATATAYVGVTSTNEVVAVRGDRVTGRVKVGDNPHGVVLDTVTHRLFVNNAKSNDVTVIDVRTLKVEASVAVGQQPQGIALDPGRHLVYTADQAAGTVTVIAQMADAAAPARA